MIELQFFKNQPLKSGQKTRIFGLFLYGLGALGAGSLGFGLNPKKHDDMKALFGHVPYLKKIYYMTYSTLFFFIFFIYPLEGVDQRMNYKLPLLLKVGIFQFFDNLPPFLDALSPKLSKV